MDKENRYQEQLDEILKMIADIEVKLKLISNEGEGEELEFSNKVSDTRKMVKALTEMALQNKKERK
jgi:hypothetical protein